MYSYIHACMHAHMYARMYMVLNGRIYMHTHVCMLAHAYARIQFIHLRPDMKIIKIKASDIMRIKNIYMLFFFK